MFISYQQFLTKSLLKDRLQEGREIILEKNNEINAHFKRKQERKPTQMQIGQIDSTKKDGRNKSKCNCSLIINWKNDIFKR